MAGKMMMLNGSVYQMGDYITLNSEANKRGLGPVGTVVQLYCWHPESKQYPTVVGLYKEEYLSGWGSLDEEVEDGQGWWVDVSELTNYVDKRTGQRKTVSGSFIHCDIELKGKQCKFLTTIEKTDLAFVEFDEDVHGCSADGLGRRGYCLAITHKLLKDVKEKSKK